MSRPFNLYSREIWATSKSKTVSKPYNLLGIRNPTLNFTFWWVYACVCNSGAHCYLGCWSTSKPNITVHPAAMVMVVVQFSPKLSDRQQSEHDLWIRRSSSDCFQYALLIMFTWSATNTHWDYITRSGMVQSPDFSKLHYRAACNVNSFGTDIAQHLADFLSILFDVFWSRQSRASTFS